MTDNRHILTYRVTNLTTGAAYETQDDPQDAICGSLSDAAPKLAAREAALRARTRSMDGFNHEVTHSDFRVHSWTARAFDPAQWSAAPMSGADAELAWREGPGCNAQ